MLSIAERVLRDVDNLRQVGDEFSNEASGRLSIATTPPRRATCCASVVAAFVQRYPAVKLELHQGSPRQVCDMVLSGEADIAIATEAIAEYNELVMLPCYQWNRCVIAPKKHPILNARPLTLEEIASGR